MDYMYLDCQKAFDTAVRDADQETGSPGRSKGQTPSVNGRLSQWMET